MRQDLLCTGAMRAGYRRLLPSSLELDIPRRYDVLPSGHVLTDHLRKRFGIARLRFGAEIDQALHFWFLGRLNNARTDAGDHFVRRSAASKKSPTTQEHSVRRCRVRRTSELLMRLVPAAAIGLILPAATVTPHGQTIRTYISLERAICGSLVELNFSVGPITNRVEWRKNRSIK
jgi:hypothetical protein